MFQSEAVPEATEYSKHIPPDFQKMAVKLLDAVSSELDGNEVRALGANKVASPVLQMLLELEADQGLSGSPGSLMDRVLDGLISHIEEDPSSIPDPSDYVGTLLRDPTSSHLLETLASRSPEGAFKMLWSGHFAGKLARLSVHPVANFVVAKALHRLSSESLSEACQELSVVGSKVVKSSRIGVFRALVDRAAAIQCQQNTVLDVVYAAFGLQEPEYHSLLFPCLLRLLSPHDYTAASEKAAGSGKDKARDNTLEPNTQGALLLQSLLRLHPPHNQPVLDSLFSLSIEELLVTAYSVTASRVLDVLLESPTVPAKAKRKLVMTFIGHYHTLVDDRIGSRVGDRCWEHADPYLREKIARSLIPHEHTLAGSFYGKFFSRKLNLYLLQRNPEEWKTQQASSKAPPQTQAAVKTLLAPQSHITQDASLAEQSSEPVIVTSSKRKRKARAGDEIDDLFDKKLGKKVKKAELSSVSAETKPEKTSASGNKASMDKALADTLGAIQSAPKESVKHSSKRKR